MAAEGTYVHEKAHIPNIALFGFDQLFQYASPLQ